jgi:hypothetical protein
MEENKHETFNEEYGLDFSKMTMMDVFDIKDLIKKNNEYDFYIVFSNLFENGNYNFILKDGGIDEEQHGEFYEHVIFRINSNEFPNKLFNKVIEYEKLNTEEDTRELSRWEEEIEFMKWLDPDLEYLGYESSEIFVDSLGLSRETDVSNIIEIQILESVPTNDSRLLSSDDDDCISGGYNEMTIYFIEK